MPGSRVKLGLPCYEGSYSAPEGALVTLLTEDIEDRLGDLRTDLPCRWQTLSPLKTYAVKALRLGGAVPDLGEFGFNVGVCGLLGHTLMRGQGLLRFVLGSENLTPRLLFFTGESDKANFNSDYTSLDDANPLSPDANNMTPTTVGPDQALCLTDLQAVPGGSTASGVPMAHVFFVKWRDTSATLYTPSRSTITVTLRDNGVPVRVLGTFYTYKRPDATMFGDEDDSGFAFAPWGTDEVSSLANAEFLIEIHHEDPYNQGGLALQAAGCYVYTYATAGGGPDHDSGFFLATEDDPTKTLTGVVPSLWQPRAPRETFYFLPAGNVADIGRITAYMVDLNNEDDYIDVGEFVSAPLAEGNGGVPPGKLSGRHELHEKGITKSGRPVGVEYQSLLEVMLPLRYMNTTVGPIVVRELWELGPFGRIIASINDSDEDSGVAETDLVTCWGTIVETPDLEAPYYADLRATSFVVRQAR